MKLIILLLVLFCNTWISAQTHKTTESKDFGILYLISSALEHNPSVKARRYDRLGAQSEQDAARWQYFPTPTTSYQSSDKAAAPGTDSRITTVGLKQPLWTNGRLSAGLESAQAKQKLADAALKETERDVALEVIQVCGDWQIASARARIAQDSIDKHQKLLQQIQRRAQEGLSAQSDVFLAQGRLGAVQADRISSVAAMDTALQRLMSLTGLALTAHHLQKLSLALPFHRDLIANNDLNPIESDPTLAKLESEVLLIQSEIKSNKAAMLPEVSAQLVNRHGDVSRDVTQWSIGLESRWGAGLTQLSSAKIIEQRKGAKLAEIEARKIKLKDLVQTEINNRIGYSERLKSFEQVLETSRGVVDSWNRQFLSGKKTWQDVMNSVRELSQAEIQLAETKNSLEITDWRLAVLQNGLSNLLEK